MDVEVLFRQLSSYQYFSATDIYRLIKTNKNFMIYTLNSIFRFFQFYEIIMIFPALV